MKTSVRVAVTMMLCTLGASYCQADEAKVAQVVADLAKQIDGVKDASDAVKAFAKTQLLPQCTNAVFVAAVKERNARKVVLDEIKKIDAEWAAAEDELPIQKELMGNACAAEIKKVAAASAAIGEVFVMDDQGANVGQNALTSDYWQGDEPKWQKSFNGAKGGVDVSEQKLDKSTNIVDQKISLPIIDEAGNVIGAVCWGVNVSSL